MANKAAVIRKAVATARHVLDDLLVPVQQRRFTGRDSANRPTYDEIVLTWQALVEDTMRTFHASIGDLIVATSKVTFLEDVAISNEDQLILSDGRVLTVVRVDRLLAPGGGGYNVIVYAGR